MVIRAGAVGLVAVVGAVAMWKMAPPDVAPWWWAGYAAILLLAGAVLLARRKQTTANAAKEARAIGALALALPLAFIALLVPKALDLGNESPGTCEGIPAQPTDEALAKQVLISDALKIKDPAATKISLGNSMGPAKIPILLEIQPNEAANPGVAKPEGIQVHVDLLRRGSDPDVSVAAKAWAKFTNHTAAELWICVARQSEEQKDDGKSGSSTETKTSSSEPTFKLDPGEYSGSVTFVDPRLPSTTIPFTVAVAFPIWPVVAMVLCLVITAGGVFISVARNDPKGSGHAGFRVVATFLGTWAGLVALIVGGGAALVAYASTYLNNNSWGAATLDWVSLAGAMFTAFVAAATAFRFARVLEDTAGGGGESADTAGKQPATGATAGVPGTWSPAGSSLPASVAELRAGTPNSVTAAPANTWTAGQFVQTGTAGGPGEAHWDGTAWQEGRAP